ncbi:MAG: YceI family protein [Pyrinomonadaceae bacterium]|nr:YceI family protein [Pyrinomonadaceae bacterium]
MQPQERKATDTQTLWAIDPTHTTVEFTVKNLFFFTVKGSLDVRDGSIVLDSADVRRSSTTVVLQSASINTGNKQRDAHLRAKDYLDADRYPEIRFQSTKVERGTDRDTLRLTGSLTVKDTSREIVLDVSEIDRSRSPNGQYVAYYSALTDIDRGDFRVDAMRLLIGRKLKIMINVQATRPTGGTDFSL